MKVIVTGGAGFIGSAVVRRLMAESDWSVVTVDCLTYAANLASLGDVLENPRHCLVIEDICDAEAMARVFAEHDPDAVLHLAAETHVDRSIDGPAAFVRTNVVGTTVLLDAARAHWLALPEARRDAFRFIHVSTDEVFGSLGPDDVPFCETTPYDPRSPYSASKASSDHMARAWHETYGLPVIVTNCTNNYGPCQFPEKLVPLMILKGLSSGALPVYGKGLNIRDWLYVDDHASALHRVLDNGTPGRTYTIGGLCEKTNLDVVHALCALLDELAPLADGRPHADLITYVADRPGHDLRYAMDIARMRDELGWTPAETFESGLRKTVEWYLANEGWWKGIQDGSYRGQRLGLGGAA